MKPFEQFKLELNEYRGASKLVTSMRAGPAIKHLRTPFKNSVRMYHGTLKTASNKIMNKGFTPTQTVNPKTLSTELSNVYLTTNPKRAQYYADLMAKTKKGKADIVAVNVNRTKNIRKGVRGDEFVVPVKDTIPVAQDVKPIKIRKGRVMQEGKGDAIQAAKMLGKKVKQISPKLMAKTKEFLRNQRSGLSTSVRRSQKQLKAVEKTDKYSKLATDRKSIHPPTADAAQAKITDRKVELIKNKNNRRRAKERILRRMFNMGER